MISYKVILLDLVTSAGFFSKEPSHEAAEAICETVNQMSREGWELMAVVPVTNDGTPAQIRQAYHYFRKTQ